MLGHAVELLEVVVRYLAEGQIAELINIIRVYLINLADISGDLAKLLRH